MVLCICKNVPPNDRGEELLQPRTVYKTYPAIGMVVEGVRLSLSKDIVWDATAYAYILVLLLATSSSTTLLVVCYFVRLSRSRILVADTHS